MNWHRTLSICVCVGIALAAVLGCSVARRTMLAIAHVTVIDMTGAPPAADQTVLIERGKITAIGPSQSIAIPHGAEVVDGTGKFLIPGLVDMHVHLTGAGEPDGSRKFILPLLIASGVTTVRDMGGYLESLIPLRKQIDEGKLLGPSIVFAGPYLDGDPPAFQPAVIVTGRDDADAAAVWLKQRGVDFLKVQSNLSRDAYFAIAEAARKQGISFVGHVPDRVTAWEAADAEQRSIEHLTGELRACSTKEPELMRKQFENSSGAEYSAWLREVLGTFSEQKAEELAVKFRARNVWQTPTLVLLRNVAFATSAANLTADERTKYVPRKLLETWRGGYQQNVGSLTKEEMELRAALLEKSFGFVRTMQNGGVKILAGTDTAAPFVFPGSSLHEELQLLVQAGLTPMEALQAATRNPAEFLGRLDSQGTIEPGKRADLVLLDANPLEDIRNTQKIAAVVLRGKLIDKNRIAALAESVRSEAMRH